MANLDSQNANTLIAPGTYAPGATVGEPFALHWPQLANGQTHNRATLRRIYLRCRDLAANPRLILRLGEGGEQASLEFGPLGESPLLDNGAHLYEKDGPAYSLGMPVDLTSEAQSVAAVFETMDAFEVEAPVTLGVEYWAHPAGS